MRIRRFGIVNPDALAPTVEVTLADHELIDNATQIIVASVRVSRSEDSMARYQLAAVRQLRASLDKISRELEAQLTPQDEGAARKRKFSA